MEKPLGKRQYGTPIKRWEDNIEKGVKEMDLTG
jgi:hypothetical protein